MGGPGGGQKPTVPLRNWKNLLNTFFSTRRQKTNSTKAPARKTKTETGSRGGQNPPYLYGIRKFSSTLPQLPATTPRHNSRYTSPAPPPPATRPPPHIPCYTSPAPHPCYTSLLHTRYISPLHIPLHTPATHPPLHILVLLHIYAPETDA